MADRVFEDRVGLHVVNPANLARRLSAIAAFGGGIIRDVFLPRSATFGDIRLVRDAALGAQLVVSPDGLTTRAFADRTLADMTRLERTAVELNIELSSDPPLPSYVRDVVERIRAARRFARLRLNLAAWKGFALPADLLASDPWLYACEQNYLGNMDELLSPLDVYSDLLAHGCPPAKATVCYAAACRVLGSDSRQRTLPDLSRVHRGVVFQDDLMANVGLLP